MMVGAPDILNARILGVRREGMTEATGKMQHAGFIRYRCGHTTVLDRSGLDALILTGGSSIAAALSRYWSRPDYGFAMHWASSPHGITKKGANKVINDRLMCAGVQTLVGKTSPILGCLGTGD